MKTLIIYNKETGEILFTQQGGDNNIENGGITNITLEVPEDKIIKSVNVETKELVLEDIPKTDLEVATERIEALENYILEQESKNVTSSVE